MIHFFDSVSEIELKKVDKDRFEIFIQSLHKIFSRVYTTWETYKIIEQLELNIYGLLFKSNYLQAQIDGIKGINNIVKKTINKQTKYISEDWLIDWILKRNIIETLFNSNEHLQLIERSVVIIRFLHGKKRLENSYLGLIWKLIQDEQFKSELFKLLNEIGFHINSQELNFFITKIISMHPAEISEEAVNVIYEAHRNINIEQLLKLSNTMLQVIFREEYSVRIIESALNKYKEMINKIPYEPYKKDILLNCLKNIKTKNNILSFKIIRIILKQCDKETINNILKETDILQVILNSFTQHYTEKYNYSMNVNERLGLLNYIMAMKSCKIPIEYYYELWDVLYEKDTEALYKFISPTYFVFFYHNI